MIVIDISEKDFKSLKKECLKVNDLLQSRAGWKGRAVAFEFNDPGAYFMKVEDSSISLIGDEGFVGRLDYSQGSMTVTGSFFEDCFDAQDVARKLRDTCLDEKNVVNLQRRTCGCCEAIPFIRQRGLRDGDQRVIAFYPKDRFDIRQALIRKHLTFSEMSLEDYPRFCSDALERLSNTGVEQDVKNDFDRYSLLFDGKNFYKMEKAPFLSGELHKGERNVLSDTMRLIENEARKVKYSLNDKAFPESGEESPDSVVYARAAYPLVGDSSVFLFEQGRPSWGVYLNSEGRISVSDGQGWNDFPQRAVNHDEALEALLNSKDDVKRMAGVMNCVSHLRVNCLCEENILAAAEDIEEWNNKSLGQEKSRGVKR